MLDIFISRKDIEALKRMDVRKFLLQLVSAIYAVIGTYMIWKTVGLVFDNDSPIVVVLTASMEPGFKRGDILFLKPRAFYDIGDMAVFQINKNEIPIVHRVIKHFPGRTLTKGDNNHYDDIFLYKKGKYYLEDNQLKSRVIAYVPFLGMITIWINTYPAVKFAIMFLMGLSVFLNRSE
ncbi:Signal peptidase complex catalytic subunit SEC11 [Dictyocoela roeselum]|nr:Signal peptidase complex catalytic subunit SEC11 [Dictyocoela roeselum]